MTKMETQLPSFQQAPVPGQHVAGKAACISIPMVHVKYFSLQIRPLCAIHPEVQFFVLYVINTLQTLNQFDVLSSNEYHRLTENMKCNSDWDPHKYLSVIQSENCLTVFTICSLLPP